ncbi:hypothetical protein [Streptomyces varsoviensis]|uniref:hypothetical protein n=1 Tax=Streptomyces varsoviensis TaxID=67373 RepID=UPI000B2549E7|nr:hypothetical protein [Streptomyces varsoviensis]
MADVQTRQSPPRSGLLLSVERLRVPWCRARRDIMNNTPSSSRISQLHEGR